jgi:hypothetical protein
MKGLSVYPLHARVYENEGQPEWQLDFTLSFDLTNASVEKRRRCARLFLYAYVRRVRDRHLGVPCQEYRP